jgi:hypothetical protein
MKRLGCLVVLLAILIVGLFIVLNALNYDLSDIVEPIEQTVKTILEEFSDSNKPPSEDGSEPSPDIPSPEPELPVTMLEVYDTSPLGLRVRVDPLLTEGNILGKVFDGTRFCIIGGPKEADGYNWLNVKLDGWVAANWLSVSPDIGATVSVMETGNLGLRVREEPLISDNVLGKLYDGTKLSIIEGPVNASGYEWWKVNLVGWVASEYLREPIAPIALSYQPTEIEETPSAVELQNKIDALRRILKSDLDTTFLPSEGFTLQRLLTPEIIERSDQMYFLSLDYNWLSIKTLRYAEFWLDLGENQLASEYVEKACRYVKVSDMLEDGSIEQLQASIDVGQRLVLVIGGKTALGVTAGAFGLPGMIASDLFSAYVDFSIDTSIREMSVERAGRRALTQLVVKQFFRIPSVQKAIGEPMTEFVGRESGLYQELEETMLTPEAREAIMRAVAEATETGVLKAAEVDASWLVNEVIDHLEQAVYDQYYNK